MRKVLCFSPRRWAPGEIVQLAEHLMVIAVTVPKINLRHWEASHNIPSEDSSSSLLSPLTSTIKKVKRMKSIKKQEWCIALDNIGSYTDPVLGLRYKFFRGERATKEKVFNMIPDMTEEEYARCFRPATEEEINGEFEWDGEKYVLKRSDSIKSIKEKAEEYGYTNWQSDEYHDGVSEGIEFDPIGHTQKTFKAGANYVLEEIEKELTRRMLEDYNQGVEEDEIAQGCMASMIMFVRQLKK